MMNNSGVITMPTISVSQEVYDRLKEKSRSWEDTPNKIIRRLLEKSTSEENSDEAGSLGKQSQPEEVPDQLEKSEDVLANDSPEVQTSKFMGKTIKPSTHRSTHHRPSYNLRNKTSPDYIIQKIVMLVLGEEETGDISPEKVVSETKKIMEFNNLLTPEDLDTVPSGKTRLESKIQRLQKRLIVEGLLEHAEGYWKLTEEGKKECEEDQKNTRLPTTQDKNTSGLDTPKETYRHTRLCFLREIIDKLKADESFRVICNDGIFQMTKTDFYEVFNNIVKTYSYLERGHYHSPKPPRKAMQFKIL